MSAPICPIHNQAAKWKEGISKAGKPYAFWSCGLKMPDGSWCPSKFNEAPAGNLNSPIPVQPVYTPVAPIQNGMNREEVITRTAVAKSLCENRDRWSTEVQMEADRVLDWILDRHKKATTPTAQPAPVAAEDPLDTCPF